MNSRGQGLLITANCQRFFCVHKCGLHEAAMTFDLWPPKPNQLILESECCWDIVFTRMAIYKTDSWTEGKHNASGLGRHWCRGKKIVQIWQFLDDWNWDWWCAGEVFWATGCNFLYNKLSWFQEKSGVGCISSELTCDWVMSCCVRKMKVCVWPFLHVQKKCVC